MSAEIGDWLTEVSAAEPVAAAELGAALVVLAEAAELPGQPLVTDLAAVAAPSSAGDDPRYVVDYAYQELLEALGEVRLQAAMAGGHCASDAVSRPSMTAGRQSNSAGRCRPMRQAARDRREQQLIARSQFLQARSTRSGRQGNGKGDVYGCRGQPERARCARRSRSERRPGR